MRYYTNENSISAGFIFGKCKTQSHNKCIRTHRERGTRKKWKILYWWIIGHINWCRNSINLDFIGTVFHRKNWMKLGRIPLTSEIYYYKNDIDGARERDREKQKYIPLNWLDWQCWLSFEIAFSNHRIIEISCCQLFIINKFRFFSNFQFKT